MKNILFILCGAFLGIGASIIWNHTSLDSTERLVTAQRKILLGTSFSEVTELLGQPFYFFPPDESWTKFAPNVTINERPKNSSLAVFYTKGPQPQLLFVILNQKKDVIYVSSSTT